MIKVLTAGIMDTVQDNGRYGYAALGINPGGAMDAVAAIAANYLCGNDANEAVIELHFPASAFQFEKPALIAVCGADFSPCVNDQPIPINTPVLVPANATLQSKKQSKGARSYLAVRGGIQIEQWLSSGSTNMKAKAGGMYGRNLQKGDVIEYRTPLETRRSELITLPFHADIQPLYNEDTLRIIDGREYSWLSACDASILSGNEFVITSQSDRMGFRLNGVAFESTGNPELISSAVTKGTIQLLPNGQLIILAADHQTTGGYPRVAHVISADLPSLAQMNAGKHVRFQRVSFEEAEDIFIKQHTHLLQLQNACNFRLHDWLKQHSLS